MPVDTDPKRDDQQEDQLQGQMSFLDHLEELRKRIIHSLIAVGVAVCVCWYFADPLFVIISKPILDNGVQLNMTKPTEGFNLELKLALLAAIFLAAPFILAQVWLFIAPGLYKHERRYALPFIIFSTLLFVAGGLFGYFIAFPFALQFLIEWGRNMKLTTIISATEYFDLFIMIELGLGVIFEIPALIFVLARMGLVSGGFLLRNTRYAILIAFIVAAVITPTTDIPNMMMMAVPITLLYMLGVGVAYVFGKKRRTEE
ncbi:MAG: twin-arginine translocase subunit TatC [Acidobacteria bacterium]|nr:MAG: twin-arginine translocase subunit TatC [Acidobacteriota bacterium]